MRHGAQYALQAAKPFDQDIPGAVQSQYAIAPPTSLFAVM